MDGPNLLTFFRDLVGIPGVAWAKKIELLKILEATPGTSAKIIMILSAGKWHE